MIFFEYTWKMIGIRGMFFICLFLLSIPNLLKEKMEHMRWVSVTFLGTMILLLISILGYLPWINELIRERNEWEVTFFFKKPSLNWITSFFSMMFSFNL